MAAEINVRPMATDESDEVARLRSVGFEYDQAKIRQSMEADVRGTNKYIVVAETGGELAGTAMAFPTQMWVSGVPLQMSAVGAVTTAPDHRGKGVCAAMMDYLLDRMYRDEMAITALFPADHRIYHRHGYTSVATWHSYRLSPRYLLPFALAENVRPFAAEDLRSIQSIYRGQQLSQADGRLTRSASWWQNKLTAPEALSGDNHIVVYDDGGVEGYMSYAVTDNTLNILEMFTYSDEAYCGLWGYLAQQSRIELITYLAPPDDPVYRLCRLPVGEQTYFGSFNYTHLYQAVSGFMLRIVHLAEALTSRFYPHDMMGHRILKITDPQLSANETPIRFRIVDGRPEAQPAPDEAPHITTDIATFSQIFCGYVSPAEARRLGQLQADDESVAWLGKAMQTKPLFIHRGDWF